MQAIVAVDLNWGIGCGGKLLDLIPADMKFFKETTLGKVVVMGRATFESLPNQAPLKGRTNIVLTSTGEFGDKDVIICRSLDELFKELAQYPSEDVFVIGGEQVYRELLPYCSEALVTKLENTYVADKHFINLDQEEAWILEDKGESQSHNGVYYRFMKYLNGHLVHPEMKTEP